MRIDASARAARYLWARDATNGEEFMITDVAYGTYWEAERAIQALANNCPTNLSFFICNFPDPEFKADGVVALRKW
jgi:hypothetical protein